MVLTMAQEQYGSFIKTKNAKNQGGAINHLALFCPLLRSKLPSNQL